MEFIRDQTGDLMHEWQSPYLKEAFNLWWDNPDSCACYLIGA